MRSLLSLLLFVSVCFAYNIKDIALDTPILKSLQKVHQLQEKAFDKNKTLNEETMQKLFKENQSYLQAILLHVKDDPYSKGFIMQEGFQSRTRFLKNRIVLNLKKGNSFAAKRDQLELGYLEQLSYLNHYIIGLGEILQTYPTQNEIKNFAHAQQEKHKTINKEQFSKIYHSVLHDNNPMAEIMRTNYKAYITISETLDMLLIYTQQNPQVLAQKTIFSLINYDEIIQSVNASSSALWLNKKISFLYLNTGKLVALLVIVILLVLSSFMMKLILRFRIFNFKHYENRKMLRPVRLLLLVTAIDYFVIMLMYPLPPQDGFNSLIILAYIMSLAYFFMEILAYIFVGYFETHKSNKNQKALISLSIDLLKMLIAVIAFVVYLNAMGVSLQTVLTTIGIFGLGIALAAKDSMANFFGSLNILLDNTFSQGDSISVNGIEGEVVKVGLRSTKIRTFDNSLVILPNAEASVKPIVNWSKRKLGKEIKTTISIAYTTPPQKVKDLIEEIKYMLSQHPELVQSHDIENLENEYRDDIFVSKKNLLGLKKERFVYLDSFEASHLNILVQTFSRTIKKEEWYKVKEEILFSILEILQSHNIDFALPGQEVFQTIRNKEENL